MSIYLPIVRFVCVTVFWYWTPDDDDFGGETYEFLRTAFFSIDRCWMGSCDFRRLDVRISWS